MSVQRCHEGVKGSDEGVKPSEGQPVQHTFMSRCTVRETVAQATQKRRARPRYGEAVAVDGGPVRRRGGGERCRNAAAAHSVVGDRVPLSYQRRG